MMIVFKRCEVEIPALWINKMLKEPGVDIRKKSGSSEEGSRDIIFKIRVPGKAVVFEKNTE